MAKFRRGHQRNRGSGIRLGAVVMGVVLVIFIATYIGRLFDTSPVEQPVVVLPDGHHERYYLPASTTGQVIFHTHYTLSYAEEYEQAEWVAYKLTREMLNAPRVPRTNFFITDEKVTTGSAHYRDYSGSGFSRGHLVPAADMAFDSIAMVESFFMSNISPQVYQFNAGIWRELEELTRDWARKAGTLYVVTGPVLTDVMDERIGRNRVAVPQYFYRVILDLKEPELKGIAFIMPNEVSDRSVMEYAVSIDSVERLTGIDFFAGMGVESLESTFDPSLWPIDERRYYRRVREWNVR